MKSTLCLHLLLVTLAIAGCVPAGLPPVPTQTETQLPSRTTIPPTSTFILTPIRTTTLTPLPTLDPEQAKERMRSLLIEPVDCSGPCFWGIVPEQTTLGKAKNIFTYLGLQIKSTSYPDKDFYGVHYDFDSGLSVTVTLTVQNGIVENLMAGIAPETQHAGVPRDWLAYSPETLINRYGSPSKVNLFLGRGPLTSFTMDMYFNKVNLIVRYSIRDIGPKSQICPLNDQFELIQIWMGKTSSISPSDEVPLENATGMTLAEFSKLMTGSPEKACFNLNEKQFP